MKKRMVRIRLLGALVAFVSLLVINFLPSDVFALGDSFVNMLLGTNDTHNHANMTAWTSADSLPAEAGEYYLTSDVTVSSTWNVPSGTTRLCLNGYGIRMTGSGVIVGINDGKTLYIDDCGTSREHYVTLSNYRGIAVSNTGTETGATNGNGVVKVAGGYITGGAYSAFYTSGSGSFIMNGGTVIGNSGNNYGAAVFMKDTSSFTMNGGSIEYNYTSKDGGAVEANNSCTVVINGGLIRRNVADGFGGGIDTAAKTFTMNGGSIIENVAGSNGGGIDVWSGSFSIGGTVAISGNTKGGKANDICLWGTKKITIADAISNTDPICVILADNNGNTTSTQRVITGNWSTYMGEADPANYFASDNSNYVAYRSGNEVAIGIPPHTHDNVEFTAWTSANSLPTSAGNYYLSSNVTISSTWDVPSGTTRLCLNGKTITKTGSGRAVNIASASTLNLYDESGNAGKITGGFVGNGNGGGFLVNGTFNMYGGTLTGNRVTRNNGSSGAGNGHGCAVSVVEGGAFRMYGGTISGNTGVHGAVSFLKNSLGLITGSAKIVNNIGCQGIHTNGNDGPVNLTVSGGEISGNAAGGVSVAGTAAGNVFNLSGNPLIYGNSDYDLIVKGTRVINITGELTNTQPIRVDVENSNRTLTSGWSEHMGSASPGNYLVAADENYNLSLSGGELYIGPKHYHSWVYSADGNIITATCEGIGTCDLEAQNLAVVAVGKTYDRTPVTAVVSHSSGWTEENGLTVPEAEYSGNTSVGTHTASVTVGGVTAESQFTISPIILYVTADAQSKDYGESDPALTYTVSGLLEGDTVTGALSRKSGDNAGKYAINSGSLYAGDNYSIAFTGNYLTINPIDATVTVVGNSGTFDYDGNVHTVSGYTATADTALYDVGKDFKFSGESSVFRSGAGTVYMGLKAEQFTNKNSNFATVTFNVTDGYLTVNPIDVTVTVTGNSGTFDYDGKVHRVVGYTATADTDLYDVNKYLMFGGDAMVLQTGAGTSYMGLKAEQFSNENSNFGTVTVNVTDGYVTVNPIDVTVTVTGNTGCFSYDGSTHYVSGYTATADTRLYDVSKYFKFSGTASVSRKDAGTAYMELKAEQFTNINDNFGTVTFNVTDGYITVNPIDVTVNVKGKTATADYNGKEHTATGYTALASNRLYNVQEDFQFSGNSTVSGINAGTYDMGLKAEQFVNKNSNFATVTFNITDGYVKINPISTSVNIEGNKGTFDYDGESHTVTGYVATARNKLYDVTKDFVFSGNASASRTDKGTSYMELGSGQFENTNPNFSEVTFNISDGYVKITPIDVAVTVKGNNVTVDYDGKEHTVTGYTVSANNNAYDVSKDFVFSGTATASGTNAGTYNMGLKAKQFSNINSNFKTVTFIVNDGHVTVNKINAAVTVNGNTGIFDYDGKEHTVSGYTATADTDLYDVSKDFKFSGTKTVSGINAGTYNMGLKAEQFINKNGNFATVTFSVADGYLTVNPIDAKVTVKGKTGTFDYDGKDHTVSGYTATADTNLYDVNRDIVFSGNALVSGRNAGTYNMGLKSEQFVNTNSNFGTVTFSVADGCLTVNRINATVTVTGNSAAADYDGKEHIVTGYTATADTDLYDVNRDFTVSGTATVSGTNAGTYNMGLKAEQFVNTNGNFATVTFSITDGYLTVKPIDVTVTVKGNTATFDYDSAEHSVTGYTATADNDLYDVSRDIVFSGNALVSSTDVGTYSMGLKAEQFSNKNGNFDKVTFNVTDGYITLLPTSVTVTVKGNSGTFDYNGKKHTVTGYTVTADTDLYDVNSDFTFDGTATVSGTNAGTYNMGLKAEQFVNTNSNFKTVTFSVTDGYVTVEPINVNVTVKGNTATFDYDGKAHTVSGYTATADNDLYDVNRDIAFSGEGEVSLTDAGTADIGLKAEQFSNKNKNFATVTFFVTDGYLEIVTVDAVIKTAPVTANPIYNGSNRKLLTAGEVDGGTLYYAVGKEPKTVPDDSNFTTSIPTAKETGSYYVWYKVIGDANHNDLSPAAVRVILSEKDWVTFSGTLYQDDGETAVSDAVVTLMKGNSKVDYVITAKDGKYEFIVPAGVYSMVTEYGQNTSTSMVTLFSDKNQDAEMHGGKTESYLDVKSGGDSVFTVAVEGLGDEASYIRKAGNISDDINISVLMTVESKTAASALNAKAISSFAKNKSLVFFDANIEKTVGSTTTVLNETANVLEIAVPYKKAGKRGLSVYYCDGGGVRTLKESSSKKDGTYFADKENGVVYIYSNRFSTFAIGYTPYYKVQSNASLGSFKGTVTVTVTDEEGAAVLRLKNIAADKISFDDIPKGQYTVTVTWLDGAKNTLSFPLTVGDKKTGEEKQSEVKTLNTAYRSDIISTPLKMIKDSTLSASLLNMTKSNLAGSAFTAWVTKRRYLII